MDIPESAPGSINQLPIEVLNEISKYIPTRELLRSCRLVSKNWYTIATKQCRKRYVKVNPFRYSTISCIYDTFKSDTNPPWSSVQLTFNNAFHNQKWCAHICEGFGSNVHSLIVSVLSSQCNYDNFVRALHQVPNVQVLDIRPLGSNSPTNLEFPSHGRIQLAKLKQIEIHYSHQCQFGDLVEFILLKTGVALNSLKISALYEVPEAEFKRMAEQICSANFRKLSLVVRYGRDQFPNWKVLTEHLSVKIDELTIELSRESQMNRHPIQNGGYFDVLEQFLAKYSKLQTLLLANFDISVQGPIHTSNLLHFPTLQNLQNLKIEINSSFCGSYNPNPQFPLLCFNLIKSVNFPNLVCLKVGRSHNSYSIDIRKLFDRSDINRFDNVKFLDVGNYHGEGKLVSIFPNLIKLTAKIQDAKQLSPILDEMNNITELDMTLCSISDNNVLLKQAFGFIRYLKLLETLAIQIHAYYNGAGWGRTKLGETVLGILRFLQPLNLTIYNAKVEDSDDFATRLPTVHHRVRFLDER